MNDSLFLVKCREDEVTRFQERDSKQTFDLLFGPGN